MHAIELTRGPRWVVLVVGDCPTGTDAFATDLADALGWEVDQHVAKWDARGRAAGPERNVRMVRAGAHVCLAMLSPCTRPQHGYLDPHPSHGASGTATLAEDAGIPTTRWLASPLR